MSRVNYHGLKIQGIRKASGSTGNWAPRSCGYDEIFYDLSTGDVWTIPQVSLGCNSWTEYHDKNIIKICNTLPCRRYQTPSMRPSALMQCTTRAAKQSDAPGLPELRRSL